MHLIAVDDQVGDWILGVGTVHRDAKSVAASPWGIPTVKNLFDVMYVVLQDFEMRAGSRNADPQRSEPMLGRVKVSNLNTFESDVTLIVNCDNSASAAGSETRRVQNCCFSRIASEGDETVARVSGRVDADQFFVNSSANVDGATRAGFVDSMLDRTPRCS